MSFVQHTFILRTSTRPCAPSDRTQDLFPDIKHTKTACYIRRMEGPSLIIIREEAHKFVGQKVTRVGGSTTAFDAQLLAGRKLTAIKSWGKHLLLCFGKSTVKIHFLMFGSYRIDEEKEGAKPRLSLFFKNGKIHFFSCSVQLLKAQLSELYDWRVDIMSPKWDKSHVLRLLRKNKDCEVADALLSQEMFAGLGNIIKNEVLFRLALHPETKVSQLSHPEQRRLVAEARQYGSDFYHWKKKFVLKKNWKIYRKRICPSCGSKVVIKKTGALQRASFFCAGCQKQRD